VPTTPVTRTGPAPWRTGGAAKPGAKSRTAVPVAEVSPIAPAARTARSTRSARGGTATGSRPTRFRGPTPDDLRRDAAGRTRVRRFGSLGPALLTALAATVLPGSGHLVLRRFRTGAAILATFLLSVGALLFLALRADRSALLATLLSTRILIVGAVGLLVAAIAWMAVIVRTYVLARPTRLRTGQRILGAGVVAVLCLAVASPLGFGAQLANSQRQLLNTLFPSLGGGTPAAEAIGKPRLNVLLVGSDAGPDRRGTRTDTMMVASLDTRTGRTILFGLPRNIQRAQFPPGSPMARRFPEGFHDPTDPLSGDYLLNGVYAYAHNFPDVAPAGPTKDPGLNLLNSAVETMLGLKLDYYVEVNMAGFAAIIDALGGLTVDVGPEPLPVGGITPSGRHVKPDRYIPSGVQHLDGTDTLAVARSRTNTDDYARMGRQRCLLQYVLQQKSPANLLANFQDVASATTGSVSTNIPQQVLPALVKVADSVGTVALESVSFDPNLADPSEPDGRFDTARPDFAFMKKVVRDTIAAPPPVAAPTTAAPTPPPYARGRDDRRSAATPSTRPQPTRGATSLSQAC
jgi:polyisoprenyl-teichoic acid--peptidoglycan teichoic acid transferase